MGGEWREALQELTKWFEEQNMTVRQATAFLDWVKDEIENSATVKEVHIPDDYFENYLPLSESSKATD